MSEEFIRGCYIETGCGEHEGCTATLLLLPKVKTTIRGLEGGRGPAWVAETMRTLEYHLGDVVLAVTHVSDEDGAVRTQLAEGLMVAGRRAVGVLTGGKAVVLS